MNPNDVIHPWPHGRVDPAAGAALADAAQRMAEIALSVRAARAMRGGLSQAGLARLAGVSEYTVSRLEAGSAWTDMRKLLAILRVLEVDIRLWDARNDQAMPRQF